MPAVQTSSSPNTPMSQLDQVLASFATLSDPQAINDALLVLDHALQGQNSGEIGARVQASVPLGRFFQILQMDQDDAEYTIDRTCNILETLLKDRPYSAIIQDPFMSQALLQALESLSPRVHALGLSQVDKVSLEETGVFRATLETPVFRAAVAGIGSESISIAARSKQTLIKICSPEERLEIAINFDNSFCLIRDLANARSSIVRLRMMEALTELAQQSTSATSLLDRTGLLDTLKNGLDTDDILTRFNVIEILAEFGATEVGSQFLDQTGIMTRMEKIIKDELNHDSLGVSAIVKLYGRLGASEQVDFVSLDMKYQILAQLERLLLGGDDFEVDESLKVETMASVGLIGGNLQTVEWLLESRCAETFIGILGVLNRDSKAAWYHSVAQILACCKQPATEIEQSVHAFYRRLEGPGQSPFLARLITAAKSQSPELAMAALSVMIPLAHYSFGVQKMAESREASMFLMDRHPEASHATKVAKFEVIEAMLKTFQDCRSRHGVELLTADQASRLDLVRRQGPFYQRATATVSIQDMAA